MKFLRNLFRLVFAIIFAPLILFVSGAERVIRFPWGFRSKGAR